MVKVNHMINTSVENFKKMSPARKRDVVITTYLIAAAVGLITSFVSSILTALIVFPVGITAFTFLTSKANRTPSLNPKNWFKTLAPNH